MVLKYYNMLSYSEAKRVNAMRRIKRIMIDLDESIAKNKRPQRICEMISIKDVLKQDI